MSLPNRTSCLGYLLSADDLLHHARAIANLSRVHRTLLFRVRIEAPDKRPANTVALSVLPLQLTRDSPIG